jgi:Putative mono-oxygenase ydhR
MVSAMAPCGAAPSLAPMHALFVSYALRDATTAQHAELCEQLAPSFAAVPGLVSKTWLANGEKGRYGGFYVFASRTDCEHFVASELFDLLRSHGAVRDVNAQEFSIAALPTATTRGTTQPDPGRSS